MTRTDLRPSAFGLSILRGMQGKAMYGGTVPADVVAGRREKNKAARKSRRANRARNSRTSR